ncbi:hypothetical protein HMPREF1981_02288 [Bacteroides pyogenes F0041]|uniref:Uncharacterized protein n=1 Tax=Bacteroides pyogenes F0041 TaxID=1321819 RepID=U2DSN5_9BACE|nr:hypothetical protein HMPREF1981_02288 [Bacteroides pyogenes F0041]
MAQMTAERNVKVKRNMIVFGCVRQLDGIRILPAGIGFEVVGGRITRIPRDRDIVFFYDA